MQRSRRLRPCRLVLMLVALSTVGSACASPRPAPSVAPGTLSADAPSCRETTLTDVAHEPRYEAKYLHRWTTWDGCDLRLDVIMTRSGGCISGVDDFLFSWPLSVSKKPYLGLRDYVRDPGHQVQEVQGFLDHDRLPASALDAGVGQDGWALWLEPSDPHYIWLASEGDVERIPEGSIACA